MNEYDRMAARDDLDPIDVTIYTVNVEGVATERASGRMDVEKELTRDEALGTLTGFLDEMHPLHLPHDDRRFLVVAATFPVHGDLAVTGTGEEVAPGPDLSADDLPALRDKLTQAKAKADDPSLSATTRRKYRRQAEALRETIDRLL